MSSQTSNLTAINSNVNSATVHYTDSWRQTNSCHSSSCKWIYGNTTGTVPSRAKKSVMEGSRAVPTKMSRWKKALATHLNPSYGYKGCKSKKIDHFLCFSIKKMKLFII
ncbi:hypothetical protein AMECASPLE_038274 [Ameca splendens]|uniref:Uncharacterized protein n=1 Tax=Ameca splendens TaxID=208324 RepID=A0ABV0YV84_9TELE